MGAMAIAVNAHQQPPAQPVKRAVRRAHQVALLFGRLLSPHRMGCLQGNMHAGRDGIYCQQIGCEGCCGSFRLAKYSSDDRWPAIERAMPPQTRSVRSKRADLQGGIISAACYQAGLFWMTFASRLNVLPKPQQQLWHELSAVPPSFVLCGGTAIALHLGHRQSVDFDFFGRNRFDAKKMLASVPLLDRCDSYATRASHVGGGGGGLGR